MRSIRTRIPSVLAVRLAYAANVGIDCLAPAAVWAVGQPVYSVGNNGSGQLGFDEALLPQPGPIVNGVAAEGGGLHAVVLKSDDLQIGPITTGR